MLKKRVRQFILLHKFLLPFWDKQVLLFFCALGFLSFGILTPYMSRLVIDYGILRGDIVVFKIFLLCGVILFVFSSLIGVIQKYIAFLVSLKIGFNIRMDFYNVLCEKPLDFFENKTTGEMLYRISTDTKGVINLITGTVPNVLLTLVKLTAISFICLWINWKATVIVVAVMPPFYLLNHFFGRKIFHMNKELTEKGQTISKTLQDNLSRIKLYKAFYHERKGLHDYKRQAISQIGILIRNFWLGISNTYAQQLLNNGFGLLLTVYLGLQVLSGHMTLGSFVALSIYLVQLSGILKSLGGVYQGIISQFVYVDRFFEVYEQHGRSTPSRAAVLPVGMMAQADALAFQDVSFDYTTGKTVLKNINFAVAPGETIALSGRSGTGKSTIARLALGLCRPTAGKILIHGRDIALLGQADLRRTIAIVLQETPLLNKTIRENLCFGNSNVSREDFLRVTRITGVDEFVTTKDDGYELVVGEQGTMLSQGQCQRIAIAMALMKRPDILILDEATNQLEQEMEGRIIESIQQHWPYISLLIISCRDNTLQRADRLFVLHEGKVSQTVLPAAADRLTVNSGFEV